MQDRWGGRSAAGTLDNVGCGNERAQMAISSYLDGEADPAERAMAEWHLAECRACNGLLASWGQATGLVRQTAHDVELERIARAIADQTRNWLAVELQPERPVLKRSQRSPGLALGGIAAAFAVLVAILGVCFSTAFPGSDLRSAPAASTATLPATVAVVSPVTVNNLSTQLPATPSVARSSLSLSYANTKAYNEPAKAELPSLKTTPVLNQYSGVFSITPGVVPATQAAERD